MGVPKLLTALPLPIGDLNPGQSRVMRVVLEVPATVKELGLIEAGAFTDVRGVLGAFAGLQRYTP